MSYDTYFSAKEKPKPSAWHRRLELAVVIAISAAMWVMIGFATWTFFRPS